MAHVDLPQLAARLVAEPPPARTQSGILSSGSDHGGEIPAGENSFPDRSIDTDKVVLSRSSVKEWTDALGNFRALADTISPQQQLQVSGRRRGRSRLSRGDGDGGGLELMWWCNTVAMAWLTCASSIVRAVDAQVMNAVMTAFSAEKKGMMTMYFLSDGFNNEAVLFLDELLILVSSIRKI
jgi:hypothetical protein